MSACETNHFDPIQVLTSGMRWHVSTPGNMLTCADMCRHVSTCDINFDTSYSDHLDVIQMLTCVSTGGNADMC